MPYCDPFFLCHASVTLIPTPLVGAGQTPAVGWHSRVQFARPPAAVPFLPCLCCPYARAKRDCRPFRLRRRRVKFPSGRALPPPCGTARLHFRSMLAAPWVPRWPAGTRQHEPGPALFPAARFATPTHGVSLHAIPAASADRRGSFPVQTDGNWFGPP